MQKQKKVVPLSRDCAKLSKLASRAKEPVIAGAFREMEPLMCRLEALELERVRIKDSGLRGTEMGKALLELQIEETKIERHLLPPLLERIDAENCKEGKNKANKSRIVVGGVIAFAAGILLKYAQIGSDLVHLSDSTYKDVMYIQVPLAAAALAASAFLLAQGFVRMSRLAVLEVGVCLFHKKLDKLL
ncbi:MAG: hypothetical protein WC488_00395 [Candidatus Micrarchaeia archaeon]